MLHRFVLYVTYVSVCMTSMQITLIYSSSKASTLCVDILLIDSFPKVAPALSSDNFRLLYRKYFSCSLNHLLSLPLISQWSISRPIIQALLSFLLSPSIFHVLATLRLFRILPSFILYLIHQSYFVFRCPRYPSPDLHIPSIFLTREISSFVFSLLTFL